VNDLVVDGLVCDLDGVVYKGDEAIPRSPEAISRLRSCGVSVVFCTNNSRSTVAQYLSKLGRLGIDASEDEVLTSATVTGEELARRGFAGASAFVIGGEGVKAALAKAGIRQSGPGDTVDLVVVGIDFDFDYDAMRRAALAVRDGARFIATNDDAALPTPSGLWPGAGAIVAAIEKASGKKAEVMGKPHSPMMEAAARRLRACVNIAVVGDRPETDLAGGAARNWTTILVASGVTAREDAHRVSPSPDVVVNDLADLAETVCSPRERARGGHNG
jgi:HAD superfamily hydrolase (TIGR01457 family)